jgi:O-antigen ligase
MRLLLLTLIAFVTLSITFDFDPGPVPGVNIKNALLYCLALGLVLKASMDRSYRLELPVMSLLFAILVGYAIFTYVAIVFVIDYDRYDWLRSAFYLKNALVDYMLFYLVFFYGSRTDKEALQMLKWLLAAFALSHAMAVLDAVGVLHVGDIEQRSDGRVQGAIGESNQYGAFAALTLPAIFAMTLMSRGLLRIWWILAAVTTAAALVMTVSRGAYVATTVAVICGLLFFRRYAPPGRLGVIAMGGFMGAVLLVLGVMALGFQDLLLERLGQGGGLASTSSGRSEIWAEAMRVMLAQPVTLLTGFGWNAYEAMPFRFAPHNHYLGQWFNLGLPGLICSVLLLLMPAYIAVKRVPAASRAVRPALMACAMAMIAIATAVFFVDLHLPWLYVWAYVGTVMRLAANATAPSTHTVPVPAAAKHRDAVSSDPFGWKAAATGRQVRHSTR